MCSLSSIRESSSNKKSRRFVMGKQPASSWAGLSQRCLLVGVGWQGWELSAELGSSILLLSSAAPNLKRYMSA